MILEHELIIPQHIYGGIKAMRKGFGQAEHMVIGFDTETVQGKPHTLQLCNDGIDATLFYVSEWNILDTFLKYIEMTGHNKFLVYAYYLYFDLAILFSEYIFAFRKSEVNLDLGNGWTAEIIYGKINFGVIKHKQKKIEVKLIDIWAFFKGGLAKAAKDLGIPVEKMKKPSGLGERKLKSQYFEKYAKVDAVLAFLIGTIIKDAHADYDVPISVSAPHMSSMLLKKKFMGDTVIPFPPKDIRIASELSYHGGKNGFYTDASFVDCTEIDINSAYPYAMHELPGFEGNYLRTNKWTNKLVGVWCISGHAYDKTYKPLMTHDGKPLVGNFKDVCVTGYELDVALRYGAVKVDSFTGYIWESNPDAPKPFYDFVEYFYAERKNNPSGSTKEQFAKIQLNSLYGKTLSKILKDDATNEITLIKGPNGKYIEDEKYLVAGSLYNPFVATLITGRARAELFKLEYDFQALHSSTDSIKTKQKNIQGTKELGGFKEEVSGPCLLVRCKVYLHFNDNLELKKYATHGMSDLKIALVPEVDDPKSLRKYEVEYWDENDVNKDDLLLLLYEGRSHYTRRRMVRVKESFVRKTRPQPLSMEYRETEFLTERELFTLRKQMPDWFKEFVRNHVEIKRGLKRKSKL